MSLPVSWRMPDLPDGWSVTTGTVDEIGFWLGGYRDAEGRMERAINIGLQHQEPLAFARVAVRTLTGLTDFLEALRGITPHLRHGMHIEVNYYSDR